MCPFIQTISYFQGNVNNSQNNVKKRLFRIRIGGRKSVLSADAPPFACAARLCRFSRFRPLIICVFLHICPVRPVLSVARGESVYAVRRLLAYKSVSLFSVLPVRSCAVFASPLLVPMKKRPAAQFCAAGQELIDQIFMDGQPKTLFSFS